MTYGTIYYLRNCCRIAIRYSSNLDDPPHPAGHDELLATEEGSVQDCLDRHTRFGEAHVRDGWYRQSPALMAHITALQAGHRSLDIDLPGERFLSTADAMKWTGRTRQALYRWAREGRITRYGDERQALWDVIELPEKGAGKRKPPPRQKGS